MKPLRECCLMIVRSILSVLMIEESAVNSKVKKDLARDQVVQSPQEETLILILGQNVAVDLTIRAALKVKVGAEMIARVFQEHEVSAVVADATPIFHIILKLIYL